MIVIGMHNQVQQCVNCVRDYTPPTINTILAAVEAAYSENIIYCKFNFGGLSKPSLFQ